MKGRQFHLIFRLKWPKILNNADVVIFVGALSQYNEFCYEDGETIKIHECLNLLENCVSNEWVSSLPFYLFLNKRDLLIKQLQIDDLSSSFPNCPKELRFETNELLKFNSPIQRTKSKLRAKKSKSWNAIKIVGDSSKLSDLSYDELFCIFGFLSPSEIVNLSVINSDFLSVSNMDGLWKQICLRYNSNSKETQVQELYDPKSRMSPWKYYFKESKSFFFKSEKFLINEFLKKCNDLPREVFTTCAVDSNIQNIIKQTLDDILSMKHE
jgi:hypothetical protein